MKTKYYIGVDSYAPNNSGGSAVIMERTDKGMKVIKVMKWWDKSKWLNRIRYWWMIKKLSIRYFRKATILSEVNVSHDTAVYFQKNTFWTVTGLAQAKGIDKAEVTKLMAEQINNGTIEKLSGREDN